MTVRRKREKKRVRLPRTKNNPVLQYPPLVSSSSPSLLAGFVAWIASPICEASAIEFSRTLGEVIYVGAGAMVVFATPLVEFYGPRVTRVSEFFVMVSERTGDRKRGPG